MMHVVSKAQRTSQTSPSRAGPPGSATKEHLLCPCLHYRLQNTSIGMLQCHLHGLRAPREHRLPNKHLCPSHSRALQSERQIRARLFNHKERRPGSCAEISAPLPLAVTSEDAAATRQHVSLGNRAKNRAAGRRLGNHSEDGALLCIRMLILSAGIAELEGPAEAIQPGSPQ